MADLGGLGRVSIEIALDASGLGPAFSAAADAAASTAQKIGSAFSGASDGIQQAGNKITESFVGASNAGKTTAKELQDSLGAVSSQLKTLGTDLTTLVTAPLVAMGAAAYVAGTAFNDAFITLRATTESLGSELDSLKTSFSQVFTSVPASANDTAQAIAALNDRLGLTGEALTATTTQFLNLSRLTGEQVVPLVKFATQAFGQWDIAIDQQSQKLDFLRNVANSTGIGFSELTNTLKTFAPALQEMGFDFDHAAALISKFDQEGVNTTRALSGMRIAINKLAQEGVQDLPAGFRTLIDLIQKAGTASEASAIGVAYFGRGANDLVTAIRKGKFDVDAFTKSTQDSADTINKAASETTLFGQQFEIFRNRVTAALAPASQAILKLGSDVLVAVQPAIDLLAKLSEAFAALPAPVQGVIVAFAAAAAAAGPLLWGLGQMAQAIKVLIPLVGGLEAVSAALSGTLALLPPVAIAFGVAIAGWAIYKAITSLQELEQKAGQVEAALSRGATATAAQTAQINILTDALTRAGRAIPSLFDESGKIKSFDAYIADLSKAAEGLDVFHGKAVTATDGVVHLGAALGETKPPINAAAQAIVDLHTELTKLQAAMAPLQDTAALATFQFAALAKGFLAGTVSSDALTAGFLRLRAARDAVDPTQELSRWAQGVTEAADRAKTQTDALVKSFQELSRTTEGIIGNLFPALNADSIDEAIAKVRAGLESLSKVPSLPSDLKALIDGQVNNASLSFLADLTAALNAALKAQDDLDKSVLQTAINYQKASDSIRLASQQQLTVNDAVGTSVAGVGTAYSSLGNTIQEGISRVPPLLEQLNPEIWARADAVIRAGEAYKQLGITITSDLSAAAGAARQSFKTISETGVGSADDIRHKWLDVAQKSANEMFAAFHEFGIKTSADFNIDYLNAKKAFENIRDSGKATAQDLLQFNILVLERQIEAQARAGQTITANQQGQLEKMKRQVIDLHTGLIQQWSDYTRRVDGIVQSGVDDLSKMLVSGNLAFGPVVHKMLIDLGAATISAFIQPATKAIAAFIAGTLADLLGGKGLGGVLDRLKSIGDAFKAVFAPKAAATAAAGVKLPGISIPGGVSGSGEVPGEGGGLPNFGNIGGDSGEVAGEVGSSGGAGSAVGSVVGSSLTGIISAVSGVVSAVSSVIGNFQQAHMNTNLARIEESTRYVKILTQDNIVPYLAKIQDNSIDINSHGANMESALGWILKDADRITLAVESAAKSLLQGVPAPTGGAAPVQSSPTIVSSPALTAIPSVTTAASTAVAPAVSLDTSFSGLTDDVQANLTKLYTAADKASAQLTSLQTTVGSTSKSITAAQKAFDDARLSFNAAAKNAGVQLQIGISYSTDSSYQTGDLTKIVDAVKHGMSRFAATLSGLTMFNSLSMPQVSLAGVGSASHSSVIINGMAIPQDSAAVFQTEITKLIRRGLKF